MIQKKPCPKCKNFMLLKRIDNLTMRKQWECPWCDHIEEYKIEKPTENFDKKIGIKGRCVSKDFSIDEDDCWKCVDFRMSDEVRRSQDLYQEFMAHQRHYAYISVCRYCRFFKSAPKEAEPVTHNPEEKLDKIEDRFSSMDIV